VVHALSQILASKPFRNSNQCSGLLRYIVEHTLAGEENLLRERVIGSEVFGRPADYETGEDPVVRLRVSEVRKRLAQYYLSDPDPKGVQIEIPSGSYLATFHWKAELQPSQLEIVPEPPELELAGIPEPDLQLGQTITQISTAEIRPSAPATKRYWLFKYRIRIAYAATVLLVAVVATFVLMQIQSPGREFKAFWAPWIGSARPVIISIGSNAVYRFNPDYLDRYAKQHGLIEEGQEFYIPIEKDQIIKGSDVYPAYQSFIAVGDVAAVSHVVSTLTQQKKAYQERFPNDVSFAELRETPSVLVGGFNNPMTLELTKHLPFVMRGGNEIDDAQDPKRKWLLNASTDSRDTADYAIITRLIQRNGDAPVIVVAGLGQYGTLAAADMICNPESIHRLTDQLPAAWSQKNLQAILRITVIDFKPTAPEVVAFKSW
jgi:hypothetical protein